MRDFLFDKLYKKKDGSIDYDRLSKARGMSKADLMFLIKSDFTLLDRAYLISGVFAGYRPVVQNNIFPARWDFRTCHNSAKDLSYISSLIVNNGNDFNLPYEYFVMDSTGNILSANVGITTTVNEQGVVKLSSADESLEQYVYPASLKNRSYKCFYCHDESMAGLNQQVQEYAAQKLIINPGELRASTKPLIETPKEQ